MRRFSLALVLTLAGIAPSGGQSPVPFINQPLVPDTAAPGGAAFTLTVNGGAFVPGATVQWNGAALATTFVSARQLTAAVPAADIAAAGTGAVTVLNPGTGVASNSVYFPVGPASPGVFYAAPPGSPYSGVPEYVGSFTGNGRPDILVAGTTLAVVLLNNGDGTFTPAPVTPYPSGFNDCLVAGDFNGDGKPDIVLENTQTGAVMTMFGNGDGTFTAGPTSAVGAGQFFLALQTGDFNGDGNLDFMGNVNQAPAGQYAQGPVEVFFGNGDGTFTAGPITTLPNAGPPGGAFNLVGLGDFNSDGKLDLVIENARQVMVMLGNGDGTFTAAPGSPQSIGFASDLAVGVADFNGDGKLDLAVANFGGPVGAGWYPVTVLLGNGDGTFTPVPNCCGDPGPNLLGNDIVVGDFNNDGKLDLEVGITNQQSITQAFYFETLLGNGDGTFRSTDWTTLQPNYEVGLWSADFSGEGKLGLMWRPGNGGAAILLQGPAPSPAPDFTLSMASPTVTVTAGDTATDNVQIADVGGFLGALSPLTCTGAPAGATCSVYQPPGELIPTAQGSFPVTVTTEAPTSAMAPRAPRGRWPFAAWFLPLAAAALSLRRKRPVAGSRYGGPGRQISGLERHLLLAVALLAVLALQGSCGATTSSSGGGTPPGTYTLTVTATAGSVTHSAQFKLVVM